MDEEDQIKVVFRLPLRIFGKQLGVFLHTGVRGGDDVITILNKMSGCAHRFVLMKCSRAQRSKIDVVLLLHAYRIHINFFC